MDTNAAINFRNPAFIRKAGMSALQKELGTVGTAYFLRQFNAGKGDYTAEREELLAGIRLDDIIKNVRDIDRKKC
jgi:hypothetical protein